MPINRRELLQATVASAAMLRQGREAFAAPPGNIQVAIDARHQAFPDERVFTYRPFAGQEDRFRFTPETFDRVIRDYNTKDLAI